MVEPGGTGTAPVSVRDRLIPTRKKKLLVTFYFMKVPLEVGMSGTSRRNLAVASRTKKGQQA